MLPYWFDRPDDEALEIARHAEEAGFERLIFWLPPAPEDEIVPRLDRYAKFIESLN